METITIPGEEYSFYRWMIWTLRNHPLLMQLCANYPGKKIPAGFNFLAGLGEIQEEQPILLGELDETL